MAEFPSEIKGYSPICLCGRGAYGQVWLVTDVVGNRRALKVVSKSMLGGDWEREFKGLRNYHTKVKPHPNLIQVYHIEDCGDFFYYTMEAADNLGDETDYVACTLEHMIQKWGALGKESVIAIFDSLLDGLGHLHDSGLVHRDIKPDNIVFVNSAPKLSDIGLISSVSQTLSLAGTQAYVPPEILAGLTREMTPAIDYYALGKTLYRAFSGQQPNNFPVVPHKVLQTSGAKPLNTLVKRACNPTPLLRIRTEKEFRAALHGKLGWWYDVKYFLAVSLKIFLSPFKWIGFGLVFVWKNPWARITIALLFILWFVSSCVAYQRLCQFDAPYTSERRIFSFYPDLFWRAMKETVVFNMPLVPNYDLYDFYSEKSERDIKRHGEKYLVSKERYLKSKYPGLKQKIGMRIGLQVGNPTDENAFETDFAHIDFEEPKNSPHSEPAMKKSRLLYQGLKKEMWALPPGGRWTRNMLELPPVGNGRMILKDVELPLYYEVGISMHPKEFSGDIEFVITAADYVGAREIDKMAHHQMRFKMHSDGKRLTFSPAIYRPQDASEDKLKNFGTPQLTYIELEDRFYDIRIAVADATIRVFIDGYAVWYAYCPFRSGNFELRYNAQNNILLQINDFSLREIGPTHRADLKDDYILPQSSKEIKKEAIDYEWMKPILPAWSERATKIMNHDWFGVSTGLDNSIDATKLTLGAGKHYLIQLKNFVKPYDYNFSVIMGHPDNTLQLKLFDVKTVSANKVQMGLWNYFFDISGATAKYNEKQKVDFTCHFEYGSVTLTGRIEDRKVYEKSFFIRGDKSRFLFEAENKSPLTIILNESIDSTDKEKYARYLKDKKRELFSSFVPQGEPIVIPPENVNRTEEFYIQQALAPYFNSPSDITVGRKIEFDELPWFLYVIRISDHNYKEGLRGMVKVNSDDSGIVLQVGEKFTTEDGTKVPYKLEKKTPVRQSEQQAPPQKKTFSATENQTSKKQTVPKDPVIQEPSPKPVEKIRKLTANEYDEAQDEISEMISRHKIIRPLLPRRVRPEEIVILEAHINAKEEEVYSFEIKELECKGVAAIFSLPQMSMKSFESFSIKGKPVDLKSR